MRKDNLEYICDYIRSILDMVKSKLDLESFEAVTHYVEHGEFEMAFEGLFIEIMKMKERPIIDLYKAKNVAELLELDKETVFDSDFWQNFQQYISHS